MVDTGWFKSSRSSGASDNCVEVRITGTGIGVRDSKDPDGDTFSFTPRTWRAFLDRTKHGDFDTRR
ncbi:uncharacterized protein DUF397 [Halopolyspora algeriensis]|uniref:Uncharacterized protein DUF397 n=1 Tax=Halopolyspora algeriensis TaxID=1500506 RepID=A0A368VFU1_9ACTN|nr:DUF397 domain-containing protein [Halopolyspora algeriensis]RCW40032.1 uncharacterized protein DUF397 [Halopolyspora algeriensis]